ncbi:acyltransferase domain-containing protein [Brachybacterium halotolerans subsp. kimchii]|nr:acyltransferase domain-containing protein [Brachybacterium halotolerans subsp. kimchii]
MELCSVGELDQKTMLDARPESDLHPHCWWLLGATVAELRERMDKPLPPEGYTSWPTIGSDIGPVGMFLYAWSLLCVVPDLLATHARRGIPEPVTRASVGGLGDLMTGHYKVTGQRGVGVFPLWGPPQSFCGVDIQLGRLSFTRAQMAFGDGPVGWALQIHVPPIGPLRATEANDSLDRATSFFATHFPEEPVAALVCVSWMMDPQLREYLPEASNTLEFQRRFNVVPLPPRADVWEDDREMMRLALQLPTPDAGPLSEEVLDLVPQRTTLHRAFVQHIRAGRHWHKPTGILWA